MIAKEYFNSARSLVEWANEHNIDKNDIIQIVDAHGQIGYYLIYQERHKLQQKDNG